MTENSRSGIKTHSEVMTSDGIVPSLNTFDILLTLGRRKYYLHKTGFLCYWVIDSFMFFGVPFRLPDTLILVLYFINLLHL